MHGSTETVLLQSETFFAPHKVLDTKCPMHVSCSQCTEYLSKHSNQVIIGCPQSYLGCHQNYKMHTCWAFCPCVTTSYVWLQMWTHLVQHWRLVRQQFYNLWIYQHVGSPENVFVACWRIVSQACLMSHTIKSVAMKSSRQHYNPNSEKKQPKSGWLIIFGCCMTCHVLPAKKNEYDYGMLCRLGWIICVDSMKKRNFPPSALLTKTSFQHRTNSLFLISITTLSRIKAV